jgi:FkbM family methyltransferase
MAPVRSDPENAPALRLVRRALRRTGFDVVRYGPDHFAHLRRAKLLRDQRVDVLLDVGADVGQYVRELRETGFTGRAISFEPHSSAYAQLERACAVDPAWECRRVALGAEPGSAELHVAGNWGSSSLLTMEQRHLRAAPESAYTTAEAVPVASLDSLRSELLRPHERAWLKADVQGFELEVLRGAADTLDQVFAMELELSLFPLYDGGASIQEVLAYVDDAGFNLLSVENGFRDGKTGQLLQVDGLFGRREVTR